MNRCFKQIQCFVIKFVNCVLLLQQVINLLIHQINILHLLRLKTGMLMHNLEKNKIILPLLTTQNMIIFIPRFANVFFRNYVINFNILNQHIIYHTVLLNQYNVDLIVYSNLVSKSHESPNRYVAEELRFFVYFFFLVFFLC